MCVCLCEFVCHVYAGALRGQQQASDCPEHELQTVVTSHVVLGTRPRSVQGSRHPLGLSAAPLPTCCGYLQYGETLSQKHLKTGPERGLSVHDKLIN